MSRRTADSLSFQSLFNTLSMFGKTSGHPSVSTWKPSARTVKGTYAGKWRQQVQRISLACVLIAFLCFAGLAEGQFNPGTPSWGAYDSQAVDTINLQNLNVLLNVPVMSKSGAFPFNYGMVGNFYTYAYGGSWYPSVDGGGSGLPTLYGEANGVLVSNTGGTGNPVGFSTTVLNCPPPNQNTLTTEYKNFFITFGDQTVHWLPSSDVADSVGCIKASFTDQVVDGTGYSLSWSLAGGIGGVGSSTVFDRSGATISWPGQQTFLTDSNNNEIGWSETTGQYTDTLGLVALTMTGSIQSPTFTWTDVNGGSPQVSVADTSYTLRSAFGCTGITDYNFSARSILTSISFPDGTALGLTYELTPGYPSDRTGRLSQITLRSGSTVSYNWNPTSGANDGMNCTYQVPNKMTRTTSDGTVTYTWTHIATGNTTTKVDIGGNKTVYTFSNTGNATVLTEVQAYINTGTVSSPTYSSTATKLVIYCYNNSSPTASSCPTSAVNQPITEVDTFTQLSGMSTYARQQTQYDGGPSGALAHYGNVTYSAQYDFGGTTPVRATTITYGSACGSGSTVNNRPCTVVTTENDNGTAFTVASSKYSYSSAGDLLTYSVSPNGGTSFLSNPTANSYNANGTPLATYDLAGNKTTYGYVAGNYTNCSGCTEYPFATSIIKGGLTISYTWNGIGGVMLTQVGPNGSSNQTTAYGYENSSGTADPWWRVRSVTDPLSNDTWITPTVTSYETSFQFNSNHSVQNITATFDGYRRPINIQKQQSPSSSNYDTVSTSYSFSGVNPTIFMSNPCSQTSGNSCTGGYGPTNTYDMFGRLISSVQSGSNATDTITYNENDVLNALTPSPSLENKKQVQNQYDGLGRLTSSCAVSSSVSGNVSCGQNVATSPANGILATTTYSSAAGSQTVTASRGPSNQQQRSITRDGLGRVTQKKTPEGGIWTYTYDSNSSCPSGWRGVNGQLASVSDPNGNLLCYSYDSSNRVTGVNANRTTCRWFYYDNGEGNGTTSGGYTGTVPTGITLTNQYGRMVEAATDGCTAVASHTISTLITDEWFAYDNDGRQLNLWQSTPHSTQYYQSTATFFGNGAPATVALASPSADTMTYTLDGEGRFNRITDATANQDIVTGTTYFPAANPEVVSLTSTDNNAYTYDWNTNLMTQFVFTVGTSNLKGVLGWNANNTLGSLTLTDGFNSGGSLTCYANESSTAGYDDLGRLLQFDCGSGNWGQAFSYDQYDNLTKTVLSGRSGTTWNPGYSSTTNHCTGCTYDSNGDVTGDGNDVYGWNEFSKVKWTEANGTPACGSTGRCATYDAFGRMVETSNGSTWTENWYTQAGGVVRMNGTSTSYEHWPTAHGIAQVLGGTFTYMPKDWVGNTRIVSNVKSNTVIADQAYTPYGEIFNIFGANNGQYQIFADTIADLFPSTTTPVMWDTPNRELSYAGRFLSPDPAGAGWNQYAYPTNPNSLGDPLGLACAQIVGAGFRPAIDCEQGPCAIEIDGGCAGGGGGGDGGGGDGGGGLLGTAGLGGLSNPFDPIEWGSQCPDTGCGFGTANPFQCVGDVCGYMTYQFVATHSNEYNGTLYSDSEWSDFVNDRIDAQRQALADFISMNSNLTWEDVYNSLVYVQTQGGNAEFSWDQTITGLSQTQIGLNMNFGIDGSGCEYSCRLGDGWPTLHWDNSMFHLDNVNASFAFPLGLLGHGLIDVLFGSINGQIPFVYGP